jgi:hypothetical protein
VRKQKRRAKKPAAFVCKRPVGTGWHGADALNWGYECYGDISTINVPSFGLSLSTVLFCVQQ